MGLDYGVQDFSDTKSKSFIETLDLNNRLSLNFSQTTQEKLSLRTEPRLKERQKMGPELLSVQVPQKFKKAKALQKTKKRSINLNKSYMPSNTSSNNPFPKLDMA